MNDDQEHDLEEENWEDEGGSFWEDFEVDDEPWHLESWSDIDEIDDFEYYEEGKSEE